MILAGDGHSNIKMADSLANPVDGKYDIVLANNFYIFVLFLCPF